MSFDIHCHRCSSWMGEAEGPMELVGLFKAPRDRSHIPTPRNTWRCKSCSWTNVFQPRDRTPEWRSIETKKAG